MTATRYADTSFLVSLYGQDANSQQAQSLARSWSHPFPFSLLHRLESRNAVRLAEFRRDITGRECKAVLAVLGQDEKAGVLCPITVVWTRVYDEAEALSDLHTPALGSRSLDVLHVATAKVLEINDFYSFDSRQKELARLTGMTVHPA